MYVLLFMSLKKKQHPENSFNLSKSKKKPAAECVLPLSPIMTFN